jgi:enterochelin esterase-like enzyme
MIRPLFVAACALALGARPALAAPAATILQTDGAPYALAGTTVHSVHAAQLKRDYQVYVSVPASYTPDGPALPVVFVTDADYAFPLVRAIAARVGGHSKAIGPFILVGLSYAVGDTGTYSRNRDYTPTSTYDRPAASDMPGRAPRYGEAEHYRRFLASEVLPLIARRYKADWSRSVFVGHSYGSLLGAAMHKDMKANVFFAVGALEQPCDKRPAAGKSCAPHDDMVGDVRAFEATLRSHRYPGLRTQLHVYEGHDHLNVYPDMITDALKWLTAGK